MSVTRLKGLSIRTLKIIDSTTIQLFGDILQGVGRNTLDGSRKKGGVKVHMMMDAFSGVAEFIKITAAKVHDRRFLYELSLPKNSFIVFDKAYNVYSQFAKWSKEQIYFVTRMKENAVCRVNKVLINKTRQKNIIGILKEELNYLDYNESNQSQSTASLKLRRITYKTAESQYYTFITNNFNLKAEKIALIYKYRWMIENLFKQIKQNFPIRYFWGNNENAIKMQIFCVLIAQILMVVVRKKSFVNMITFIRQHILSFIYLIEYISDALTAWKRKNAPPSIF